MQEIANARAAERDGNFARAFSHLERAHVLGQAATREHVRVHCAMLAWGCRLRNLKEIFGQLLRIAGALTKTAIGFVPSGNTGGANVSPFRRMPIAPELASIMANMKNREHHD